MRGLWDGRNDALKPGKIRNFIKCPAGEFWMGAGNNDTKANGCEKPRHQVQLSEFLLQTTAVTIAP